jgi:hypothetical protein
MDLVWYSRRVLQLKNIEESGAIDVLSCRIKVCLKLNGRR